MRSLQQSRSQSNNDKIGKRIGIQKKSCHFREEQRRGADLQEMADRPVDGEVKRIDQKPFFYVTLDSRRP